MKKIFNLAVVIACSTLMLTACKNSNASAGGSGSAVSGSGSDTYMELTNNTKSAKMNFQILFKAYISHDGKARMEMYRVINSKPALQSVGLSSLDHPGQTINIEESDKTYSINEIDTADQRDANAKYTVSKIGNEKIMGYDCVHARVIATKNYDGAASFMNSVDTTDLWLSNDLPVAQGAKEFMKKSMRKSMGLLFNNGIASQLRQMGCEGFMVKSSIRSKKVSSVTQLRKLSKDNFSGSIFEIPAGYKQTQ